MVQYVITLANSVVGVSVLALPFCFQQCGIVLATLMLVLSAIMTRVVCHFLLKGGIVTRRRTYELLAYHTYGPTGKLLAELTIIGFLLGTLIAFLVVMGDLGPQLIAEIFDIENNSSLRTIVMTGLALFVGLPLGLLKNIDSLGSVSIVTLMFYLILVCKILASGFGPLWAGSCLNQLNFWRPAGILQCIPIFAMALSCQTQIFPIYDSLPEPSLAKMNSIVKNAVYLCTSFYFLVGFFGYVAFCSESVGGNILVSFKSTMSTQFIKCCFVFSIAFSIPLVILPCRASLHSLIWRDSMTYHHLHEAGSNYIPESRLRLLTVVLITSTLVIGLMIPNIELVLGLVGSTAGSVICIIFPALMFISVTPKNTTEKLVAKIIFVIGVVILILTTYATLYAVEQANSQESIKSKVSLIEEPQLPQLSPANSVHEENVIIENLNFEKLSSKMVPVLKEVSKSPEVRVVESIIPEAGLAEKEEVKVPVPPSKKSTASPKKNLADVQQIVPQDLDSGVLNKEPAQKPISSERKQESVVIPEEKPAAKEQDRPLIADEIKKDPQEIVPQKPQEPIHKEVQGQGDAQLEDKKPVLPAPQEVVPPIPKVPESSNPEPVPPVRETEPKQPQKQNLTLPAVKPPVEPDLVPAPQKPAAAAVDGAAEELLKRLEQQQEEQRKLIEEQRQVLEELKKHHEEHDQAEIAEGDAPKQLPPPDNANKSIEKKEITKVLGKQGAGGGQDLPKEKILDPVKAQEQQQPKLNQVPPIPVNVLKAQLNQSETKEKSKDGGAGDL